MSVSFDFDLGQGGDGTCRMHMLVVPTGKDGKPIMPGDTVYGGDGRAWKVLGIGTGDYNVVARPVGRTDPHRELKPRWLTHEQPDTWERLYKDVQETNIGVSDLKERASKLYVDGLSQLSEKLS